MKAAASQAQESAAAAAQASSRHRAESAKKLVSLAAELRDLQSRLKVSDASARRELTHDGLFRWYICSILCIHMYCLCCLVDVWTGTCATSICML